MPPTYTHVVIDLLLTLATTPDPQRGVGRAFLLLVVLIIIGILLVLGLILAGFARFARDNATPPKRLDRYKGVDAWAESARRADTPADPLDDDEDWEADEDDEPSRPG